MELAHELLQLRPALLLLGEPGDPQVSVPPAPLPGARGERRAGRLTSRTAFCTVSWLYTRAPSSPHTFRSSSLLSEKSWGPVRMPRFSTILGAGGRGPGGGREGGALTVGVAAAAPAPCPPRAPLGSPGAEGLGFQPGADLEGAGLVGERQVHRLAALHAEVPRRLRLDVADLLDELVVDLVHVMHQLCGAPRLRPAPRVPGAPLPTASRAGSGPPHPRP